MTVYKLTLLLSGATKGVKQEDDMVGFAFVKGLLWGQCGRDSLGQFGTGVEAEGQQGGTSSCPSKRCGMEPRDRQRLRQNWSLGDGWDMR